MHDPSVELVTTVRRFTRAWAARRGLRHADTDDLEGDALEWLATYQPPDGWNPTAATLHALRWHLGTLARTAKRDNDRRPALAGLPIDVEPDPWHTDRHDRTPGWARALWHSYGTTDPAYDQVDAELRLNEIPDPDERQALIAVATHGDAAALARRQGVHLSTIHHRARRARTHLAPTTEEPAA